MFIFSFLTINVLLKKRRDKERKVKGRGCWRKNREGNGEVGKGGFLALEKPSLFSPPRSVISPQSICPEARFLICRMGVKTFFSWCYVSKETYWVGQKVSSDFSIPPMEKPNQLFGQPNTFVTTAPRLPGLPGVQNALRSEGREDKRSR